MGSTGSCKFNWARYPIGYPATKSGVEIDLLKYFFTPLEAKIALCLTLRSISLTPIRKRLKGKFFIDLSPKELSALLDEMFQKASSGVRKTAAPFVTVLPCWPSACLNTTSMISPLNS